MLGYLFIDCGVMGEVSVIGRKSFIGWLRVVKIFVMYLLVSSERIWDRDSEQKDWRLIICFLSLIC